MKARPRFDNVPNEVQETIDWLLLVEEYSTARALARSVAKFLPQADPRTNDFLAYVLWKSKAYREASEVALKTMASVPESLDAKFNAARCVNMAGDPRWAEKLIDEVLSARPDWMDARIEKAVYVSMQGRFDESMVLLERLEKLNPASEENGKIVRFNLGWHQIRKSRFKEGMRNLSAGRELGIWGSRVGLDPRARLEPSSELSGKTVLLIGEGGAGDEILGARFGETIEAKGGKAVYSSAQGLEKLFRRAPGIHEATSSSELPITAQRFDLWAPVMDLPVLLDIDVVELPARPYLRPDPGRVAKWSERISPRPGLKVGLRWRGNPLYEQDLMRSVPFRSLEQLGDIAGVSLYSLQRDDGVEERPEDSVVVDLGPSLTEWEETAAIVSCLDLVITSCTSIAHLSAAMGKATWILPPLNCYYPWAGGGESSPWYPTARIFRQVRHGSWDEPLAQVFGELQRLAERRSSS